MPEGRPDVATPKSEVPPPAWPWPAMPPGRAGRKC